MGHRRLGGRCSDHGSPTSRREALPLPKCSCIELGICRCMGGREKESRWAEGSIQVGRRPWCVRVGSDGHNRMVEIKEVWQNLLN